MGLKRGGLSGDVCEGRCMCQVKASDMRRLFLGRVN